MLKEVKEKCETEMKEMKANEVKSIEMTKHKEIVKKFKQDLERKEFKISSLESKLETSTSELEKVYNASMIENKMVKSESLKENRKIENVNRKLIRMEEAARTGTIVIRCIINEMVVTVEKLRSDLTINQNNMSRVNLEDNKLSESSPLNSHLQPNSIINDSIQE